MSAEGDHDIVVYLRGLFARTRAGRAVEAGAGDGVHMSTTRWMEYFGWDVLCVEPNPELFSRLRLNRKRVEFAGLSDHNQDEATVYLYDVPGHIHHDVVSVVEPLTDRFLDTYVASSDGAHRTLPTKLITLDSALEKHGFPDLDFLSLDVDGTERKVLAGLDIRRWNPQAVMIENAFAEDDIREWFSERGYFLAARIDSINEVFVRDDS
jgi:FkbM family methyltransferase